MLLFFFFQAEDGIRDIGVTGVQTCALPISGRRAALKLFVALALLAALQRALGGRRDALGGGDALGLARGCLFVGRGRRGLFGVRRGRSRSLGLLLTRLFGRCRVLALGGGRCRRLRRVGGSRG